MNVKDRSLGNWIIRRFKAAPAQSMVEFAMALPVLLLLTFGVIEFGRLLQAWLALENGARFGARYAITGEYNKAYCDEAGAALGLSTEDAADGAVDCKIEVADPLTATDDERAEARDQTQALQDWARMPSIRDSALAGASGIALDESVSGDYLQYLVDAESHGTTFSSDYRGDPSKPGFFMISICSNRVSPALTGVTPPTFPVFLINDPALDASLARYYPGHTGESDYQYFPTLCMAYNKVETGTDPLDPTKKTYSTSQQYYMDDAGGPGDRVRITLTYRHNMIMPLLSDWWPTLRLNTSRDGVVEKFRTSRVTGLSEGNMNPDTPTPSTTQTATFTDTLTPSLTFTPTSTFTNTATFTPTATFTATATSTNTATSTVTRTSTATLLPCTDTGNGLRAEYYNWDAGAGVPPSDPFSNPIVVNIAPTVNFSWSGSPASGIGDDYFAVRFVGEVMPAYTETYTFYFSVDDGGREWVNNVNIDNTAWHDQGETEYKKTIALTRCQKYPIIFEMYENTGGAVARLRWRSASQPKQIIPMTNLFGSLISAPPTATNTATRTITPTFTITNTPSITPTPSRTFTVTRTLIPSSTFTPTRTLIPSSTFTRTSTRTITDTPTVTETFVITSTFTRTSTITHTPTRTSTRTATVTETFLNTRTFTATATRTSTGSPTPTNTPKGTGG
jgi:hypothetical protein